MKKWMMISVLLPATVFSQSNKITGQLDSLFQSYFNVNEPGGAVLIVRNGKEIYKKGFGVANIKTKEPITPHTLFNVGSVSKTFVAYGILKLASEKKLSLDDNLYKYFPDFKNEVIAKQVRLYNLLTHTSGLPDSRKVSEQREFYLTAKDAENWEPIKHTDTLEFLPGTKYKYSNPAFNGLALIIEKVTGKKWQHYISEIIFKPAGMKTSTITDGPHPESGVSHGYELNDKKLFEELDYGEEPTFAAAGNGGVWSSVEELWKYEQAIQKNIFLSKQWIDSSRTVFTQQNWTANTSSVLGLSWFITNESGRRMIGHTGSQGGFRADYVWIPEANTFYVLLANTPKPLAEIRKKALTLLNL
jgi:CubicO group peptidase (beta-lactamase class C family)